MLKIKLAFIIFGAVFTPLILGWFIPLTPFVSILVGAVIALIGVAISWLFLKPLSTLIKSSQSLIDGNLNHRIDIRSGDEFENVGKSFNSMTEKLAHTFQTLEKDQQIAISEKNTLNEILSSLIDGIIALDFNKNIILMNKAAEEITGYTQGEIQGKTVDQMIHLFSEDEEIISKSYCQGSFNRSCKLIGKNGKQTKVDLITSQVEGAVQTHLSCILILHDLSKEEELEQMKFDFVSMASHELRTPLTSIIGYLSVFLNENKNKLANEEFDLLNRAYISTQQLLTLVQNLLSVNKIERDQMSVSVESVDYLSVLSKTVEDLKNQAAQKNIVLTLTVPQTPLPKVMADPVRIGEVVTNLVANAINYTNAGGRVEVTAQVSPTEITTMVSDTGVGIPKEAIPHLFNKFFRVYNQVQPASKGTGLGLYITKSIIEKLHGKIWVESEVGKGSKFIFTLPAISQTSGILDTDKFISQTIQAGGLNY